MRTAVLLPFAALALAVPAFAQQELPPPPGAMRPIRPDPAELQRHRADDMALVLGLSVAQRLLLDAFLARPQPPVPPGPPSAPGAPPPGFGQHLDRIAQDAVRRSTDDRRHIVAARAFYQSLDARQRAVFEALLRLSHDGPGGGHGPGHGGLGGPGGPGGPDMPHPPGGGQ